MPMAIAFRYAGAVLAVAAAAALRWLLQDDFGNGVAFITFFPTVALVAMFAGGGPSLLATFLSAAVVGGWIGFGTRDAGETTAISLFILAGLVMSVTAEMLRRARRRELGVLEGEVVERERRLRILSRAVEQSPASVVITDPAGNIEYVNPMFSEVTGYSLDEVRSKNPRLLKSGHQPIEFYRELWQTITAGRTWKGELCNRRKNGDVFWEYGVIAPIHDDHGGIAQFVAIKMDITERRRAVDALRESEQRLRAILNTVVDAIITIDRKGTIVGLNPAAERMFGYATQEMVGRNVSMLMPAPFADEHDRFLDHYHRTGKARIIGIGREALGRRKNGAEFPIELAVGEIEHLHMYVGVIRDVTERKRMEIDLLKISEREQHRIGMDLHDGLGPQLAAISILNDALLGALHAKGLPEAAMAVRLQQLLKDAGEQMRAIARGLLPVTADPNGLMAGLESYLRKLDSSRAGGARVTFDCPAPVRVHDPTIATHLFRIAQEAVRNAASHAAPRHISVRLTGSDGRVCVEVQDDGNSGDVETLKSNGLGLRTMQYRAGAMGGSLEILHPPEGGTVVRCCTPQTETPPVAP